MLKFFVHNLLVFLIRLLCLPVVLFVASLVSIAVIVIDTSEWVFWPVVDGFSFMKKRHFYSKYWNKLRWITVFKMAMRKLKLL